MKYILATLLSTTSALLHAGNTSPFITHPEITLGVTQSTEQLDWNIAGPTINILSELKWKHTSTLQPRLRVAVTAHSDFHLAAAYSQGKLGHGTNQDTDYNDNDRKSPILQSPVPVVVFRRHHAARPNQPPVRLFGTRRQSATPIGKKLRRFAESGQLGRVDEAPVGPAAPRRLALRQGKRGIHGRPVQKLGLRCRPRIVPGAVPDPKIAPSIFASMR